MQVNSYWVQTLGLDSGQLLRDPCLNTKTGARILKKCIDRHGYTWEAVGCYNARSSDKRVKYSWKIFKKLEALFLPALPLPHRRKRSSRPRDSELTFSVRDRFEDLR